MNPELTKKLNAKYPEMFLFHNFRSSKFFVFECADGWHNIVDNLLNRIHLYVKNNNERVVKFNDAAKLIGNGKEEEVPIYLRKQIEAIEYPRDWPKEMDYPTVQQIKEKFGILRVYLKDYDNTVSELCNFAECMSQTTCEVCGNIGKLQPGRWIKTLCDGCEVAKQEQLAQTSMEEASFASDWMDRE